MNRSTFFERIGKHFDRETNLNAVFLGAGLDYTVSRNSAYTVLENGRKIVASNTFFNVRDDSESIVGAVSGNYKIVQNRDAFKIVESFIDRGLRVVSAGHFHGTRPFILLESEPFTVLGDDYINYFFVVNSFDGSTSISVQFLPMRLVCSNGLRLVNRRLSASASIRHFATAPERLKETERIFFKSDQYVSYLKSFAENLNAVPMSREEFEALCDVVYPAPESETASELALSRYSFVRNALRIAYDQDDLQNFNGTAYKAIMAIADYESHVQPTRTTSVSNELPLRNMLSGMSKVNHAVRLITEEHGIRLR